MSSLLKLFLFSIFSVILISCSAKKEEGTSSAPVDESPDYAEAPKRASWNEAQGTCLTDEGEVGYNSEPIGNNAQCVDFSDRDLTGKNFSGYDLRGVDFRKSVLAKLQLEGSLIKGLQLEGAEIENAFLLKWLLTGIKPIEEVSKLPKSSPAPPPQPIASVPTPAQQLVPAPAPAPESVSPSPSPSPSVAENVPTLPVDEEENESVVDIEPDVDEVPIIVTENAPQNEEQIPAPAEELHLIEMKFPTFDGYQKAPDVANYFKQVKSESDLGSWGSQINLTNQQLQRYLKQSLIRVSNSKIKESNIDLKAAKTAKNADEVAKLQSQVQSQTKSRDQLKEKTKVLAEDIAKTTTTYKAFASLASRSKKVVTLIDAFIEKYGDLNARLPSGENFAETAIKLAEENKNLENKIADLKDEKESTLADIKKIDAVIAEINLQVTDSTAKLKEANTRITNLKAQIKATTIAADKAELQNQLNELIATRDQLTQERNALKGQIAALREQRAVPKQKYDETNAQIQLASQERQTVVQKQREAESLQKIFALL